jgi:hypothetical protein
MYSLRVNLPLSEGKILGAHLVPSKRKVKQITLRKTVPETQVLQAKMLV